MEHTLPTETRILIYLAIAYLLIAVLREGGALICGVFRSVLSALKDERELQSAVDAGAKIVRDAERVQVRPEPIRPKRPLHGCAPVTNPIQSQIPS